MSKILGVVPIGIASSVKKFTQLSGWPWQMINYNEKNIAQRIAELTHNEKVNVVYDLVGKATWLASLNYLKT